MNVKIKEVRRTDMFVAHEYQANSEARRADMLRESFPKLNRKVRQ